MDSSPPAVGGLAVEALDLLIDAVATVGPDAWDQPSNLDGWTVRDLVGHATGSAAKIVALVEGGELWHGPSQPADWITDDPVAALHALADRLSRALPDADFDAVRPSPAGEVAVHQALGFPVADLAMHSWDIHRCAGRLIDLPDGLLGLSRDLVGTLPEQALRRPGAFGPAQPAPEDASPTTALMAFLGRQV